MALPDVVTGSRVIPAIVVGNGQSGRFGDTPTRNVRTKLTRLGLSRPAPPISCENTPRRARETASEATFRHNEQVSSQTLTPNAASSAHVSVDRPNMTQVGTIVWLSSELMFFAGMFAIYFTHRSVANPDEWAASTDKLNLPMVVMNTAILVLSSVTCQFGVLAAEHRRPRRSGSLLNVRGWGMQEWYTLTFVMGAVFVALQVTEYAELVEHGITISDSSFGTVFYLTTGFHGLHVVGGLLAFLFVLGSSFAARNFGHREEARAIVTSYYWHFVDVIWVALFFVIYFLR